MSDLRYFNKAITITDIQKIVAAGPNMSSNSTLSIFPPYLSMCPPRGAREREPPREPPPRAGRQEGRRGADLHAHGLRAPDCDARVRAHRRGRPPQPTAEVHVRWGGRKRA